MAKSLILFWVFIFSSNPGVSPLDQIFSSGFHVGNNITLDGVVEIQSNGILKLTNDTHRLIGHAFYPNPIKFKNSMDGKPFSFSTAFAFAIVPEYAKLGGHGFAFTISPRKEFPGGLPSQYLGLLNASDQENFTNHVFAIEFDIIQDFEFRDIIDNHVGININNLTSNASVNANYFVEGNLTSQVLNLKSGKTIQAWITMIRQERY